MAEHFRRECRAWAITGPSGTTIMFGDNLIHRAALARRSQRGVLVLHIRPACFRAHPYIDPRWTGSSFEDYDYGADPWQRPRVPKVASRVS